MKLAPIDFRYGKLPNGWPQPTFLNVSEDGSLNIEWCFGEQGAQDSWRVMFCWDPEEGAMCCKTTHDDQESRGADTDDEEDIAQALDEWLSPQTGGEP